MTNAMRVALPPRTPARAYFGTPTTRAILEGVVADSMRQIRDGADNLTARDHDRIKQFSNGQYLSGVLSIAEISQKCRDMATATAFPEALRGFMVQHHPAACCSVIDAFRGETDANGIANMAQLEWEFNPTEANRARAVEALNKQLAETHRALTALHKHRGLRIA